MASNAQPLAPLQRLPIKKLSELLADKTEPPPAIIANGILLEKSLLLISGQPKAKKSFLAYNLAVALASGQGNEWLKVSKPCHVLVLSAEGGYFPNRERLTKMWNAHHEGDPTNLD